MNYYCVRFEGCHEVGWKEVNCVVRARSKKSAIKKWLKSWWYSSKSPDSKLVHVRLLVFEDDVALITGSSGALTPALQYNEG